MNTAEQDRLARVALSTLYEAGTPRLVRMTAEFSAPETLDTVLGARTRADGAARRRLGGDDPYELAAEVLQSGHASGARLLVPGDAEWPKQLSDLDEESHDEDMASPLCLWVRGEPALGEATAKAVSIVGARAATAYGKHVAGEFGYGLAERGYGVVSGGAFGIDAAAHRGTLAAGGMTVAVLASGVDVAYPAAHAALLEQVAERGLLMSEWPPGTRPQRHRFLIRNRLIAALGLGTVVVEAAARSGARVTARQAETLRRHVMAVPGPVTSPQSFGVHELLRDYDARLVTTAAQVVQEVGAIGEALDPVTWTRTGSPRDQLSADGYRIVECLPHEGGIGVEDLAVAAGVRPREVRRLLPDLVAAGFVEATPSGYRAVPFPAARRTVPVELR